MHKERVTKVEDRLIVALDVESAEAARTIIEELDGLAPAYKIGLQLFTAAGPKFVEQLANEGHRIFLDLKFHDIPNTVAKAGVEAAKLGVWMFNVHASGGSEMMKATVGEVSEYCAKTGTSAPEIIAVTVLTSSDSKVMSEIGVGAEIGEQVGRLARLTAESGLSGVVASAKEIEIVRSAVGNEGFLIVTPGIRPQNATFDDQKRVMTPGTAITAGADHLVVGRPITGSSDRRQAAEQILEEICAASRS